jgi:hypothetical protein
MSRLTLLSLLLLTACASGTTANQNNANHDGGPGPDGAIDANVQPDGVAEDARIDAAVDAKAPDGSVDAGIDTGVIDGGGTDGGGTDGGGTDGGVVCELPPEACVDGTEDRDTCGTARVLSRASLPFDQSGIDIAGASDSMAPSCIPHDTIQNDHFYRVFLLAGETLSAWAWPIYLEGFNVVLVLYRSETPCSTIDCAVEERCVNAYNDTSSGTPEAFVYTAAEPGWYVISVDSRQIIGTQYRLRVEVDCTPPCGC